MHVLEHSVKHTKTSLSAALAHRERERVPKLDSTFHYRRNSAALSYRPPRAPNNNTTKRENFTRIRENEINDYKYFLYCFLRKKKVSKTFYKHQPTKIYIYRISLYIYTVAAKVSRSLYSATQCEAKEYIPISSRKRLSTLLFIYVRAHSFSLERFLAFFVTSVRCLLNASNFIIKK